MNDGLLLLALNCCKYVVDRFNHEFDTVVRNELYRLKFEKKATSNGYRIYFENNDIYFDFEIRIDVVKKFYSLGTVYIPVPDKKITKSEYYRMFLESVYWVLEKQNKELYIYDTLPFSKHDLIEHRNLKRLTQVTLPV